MRTQIIKLMSAAVGLCVSLSAPAADLMIKNAKLVDGIQRTEAIQDIIVKGDKIVSIGTDLPVVDGFRVIDAAGKPVTPGLFNVDTQIGLQEVGAVSSSVDSATTRDDVTASLMVADAYNASSTAIPYNRMLGITHSIIQPSNGMGLFAGSAAVVKLTDTNGIIESRAAMIVDLANAGSELAGGSKAAAMAKLREAIEDTRDYARNKSSYNAGNRRSYSLSRHDLEALIPVIERRMPLLVHIERASDIERVLAFAAKQKITLILSGVSEGWRVADKIAAAGVPVIFDPINNLPSSYETLGARLDNAKILNDAGVTLMFTGMGWQTTHNAYLVRQSAGNAVANGLPYDVAIQAITSNPAKIFGVPEYGQIKVGNSASLVIWSGDPLEVMSNPTMVMIDGQEYALESRATRLRDRYFERLKARQ
ncbi:amidohydrolase family protein [Arenicella xantha]|uniref:Imidazolonepropionase-like amidohydrolase n=1 Tax=Arenicella xantha TaxID=644221 RepID=A0A395JKN5_9GAMM|nr:amidohydrolase family protein [Arenicella xantha]RBP51353.1 imidazolonepropionase-like amidohydrolase [Arenicella xantha]